MTHPHRENGPQKADEAAPGWVEDAISGLQVHSIYLEEEILNTKKEPQKAAQRAQRAAEHMRSDMDGLAERVETLEVARPSGSTRGADLRIPVVGGGREVRRAELMEEQRRFWAAWRLPNDARAPFHRGLRDKVRHDTEKSRTGCVGTRGS